MDGHKTKLRGINWSKVMEVGGVAIVVILGVMQGISELYGIISKRRFK